MRFTLISGACLSLAFLVAACAPDTASDASSSASPSASPAVTASAAPETIPSSTPAAEATPSASMTPSASPTAGATETPAPVTAPSPATEKAPAPAPTPAATATPPQLAPNAAPEIVKLDISATVVHPGDTVSGDIETSSNVASVEARIANFSIDVPKVAEGRFALRYTVPHLPFFLLRTYTMDVIARNTAGAETHRSVAITIR